MRKRLTVLLPLLVMASGAIWSVAPQGTAQQPLNCDLRPQRPEHPLEMNTVVSDPRTSQFRDPLFKHVIMEKEIYECVENEGTDQERRFTRDIETFIEIIQRAQGGRTSTVEKRVEEIVCDTGNSPFGVSCSARDVPLEQVPPDVLGCFPRNPQTFPQPTDPVEMNTAITSRQDTVKTIKVDKAYLECILPGDFTMPGHLYVFTEIVEGRIGGAADTIRPTEKKFQAILCLIDDFVARIVRCNHFIPAGTNG
jgi:hypothetical protein